MNRQQLEEMREAIRQHKRDMVPDLDLPLKQRLIMTALPIGIFLLYLLAIFIRHGKKGLLYTLGASIASYTGGGKFIILGALPDSSPVSVFEMSILVVILDTLTAMILLANLNLIYKLPFVGPLLASAEMESREFFKAHRWIKKLAWTSLVFFVALPVAGTGAVGGVFLAKFLGMRIVESAWGIFLGSIGGAFMVGASTELVKELSIKFSRFSYEIIGLFLIVVILVFCSSKFFLDKYRQNRYESSQINKDVEKQGSGETDLAGTGE